MLIPDYIIDIDRRLKAASFQSYIVGGCVRDFIMERKPNDWDLTTNARPEEVLAVFPEAKYENDFGTVILPIRDFPDGELRDVVEITTYRSEQGYNDRRHPDTVIFESEIDKDLERRDFTVNALAIDLDKPAEPIDLFGGAKDIRHKVIRAVGEPAERFKEDALRMLRAIRFCCQLGFSLEEKTKRAIVKLAGSIKFVSKERVRDELVKILASERPAEGIALLQECKLLQYIIPELSDGEKVDQGRHHIHPVFKHNLLSLKYCPSQEWPVRLAALLHDIGKTKTKKIIGGIPTFYNHEYVGAKLSDKIMQRLKFPNEERERVVNLVRNHMFYYNVGEVTAASVRRLIVKVGASNLRDLIDLRVADRLGSGVKKAMPYKLRHLQYMMEKVQNDPISVKMLKLNGNDLMSSLGLEPGPKIGAILDVLLGRVIEDPTFNEKEELLGAAKELIAYDLAELRQKARDLIEEQREKDDSVIKRQYKV